MRYMKRFAALLLTVSVILTVCVGCNSGGTGDGGADTVLGSGLWLSVGDTGHRIKHAESISITPMVFGIRKSLAEELGFAEGEVSVSDLLRAIQSGELRFCMTSATQSNSGASAYIGFLYALLGNPEVITEVDLQNENLKTQMEELLSGVDRSSGSSDWLKDMFLEGNYDAMVNYECLIIQANRELEERGQEPGRRQRRTTGGSL